MAKNNFFNADVFFALFVAGTLGVLLIPLPSIVLDLLLLINISLSMLLLMLIFYLKRSLDISSFPTILLVLTLFRLSLNVASTKLILQDGQAGDVIHAFGNFVVGGNYVIGAVIFIILVVINFMVIVKGSGRIAEVSARFTLDAMPGKQMSIDADLNAGVLDDEQAKARRQELSDEAEFYGAMDGASKFVSGDAMAGIVITAINVVGGIAVGTLQQGLPVVEALKKYTLLTIGDGLVSQIPGLMISISAGMLVAKTAGNEGGTGEHLFSQVLSKHQPIFITAIIIPVFGMILGFFFVAFMLSLILFIIGFNVYKRNQLIENEELDISLNHGNKALPGGAQNALEQGVDSDEEKLKTDAEKNKIPIINPMTLEVGFSLIPLVSADQDGDLVDRIAMIREQIKEEMGFLIPPISIQDNIELASDEYRIMVRGLERARGSVHPKSHMAINPGDIETPIEGIKTQDPAFGFDAIWINENRVNAAEDMGYTVVDAASVITTHVTKIVKDYAANLLSRQDVSLLLEQVKEKNDAVVTELIPQRLNIGVIHRVLQHLLDEQIPIHDMALILETLSDYALQTKDPIVLAEFARQALKGHIIARYISDDRVLYAMTLHPMIEEEIQNSITQGAGGGIMSLPPERAVQITDAIFAAFDQLQQAIDADIVLLVSPLIRLHLFRMVERKIADLPVLSYSEISDDIPLEVLRTVEV